MVKGISLWKMSVSHAPTNSRSSIADNNRSCLVSTDSIFEQMSASCTDKSVSRSSSFEHTRSTPSCVSSTTELISSSFEQTTSLCVARSSSTFSTLEQIRSFCDASRSNFESATSTQSPIRAVKCHRFSPGCGFTFAVSGFKSDKKNRVHANFFFETVLFITISFIKCAKND